MARALCLFLTVDASKVPARQRAEFLALTIRRHAPFPDPEYAVTWSEGHASIWYWSASRINNLLGAQPFPVSQFIPEALLTGHPQSEDCVELLQMAYGVSGRIWQQGQLTSDRWWSEAPNEAGWISFLRGAGLASSPAPIPVAAPLQIKPWAQSARKSASLFTANSNWLKHGMVAIGALACLAIGFEAGAGFRGLTDIWTSQKNLQALQQSLSHVLEARTKAEAEVEALQHLLTLQPVRGQGELLAEVKKVMPAQDWSIVDWRQATPENLEIIFRMENADTTALVSAWESSPMFTEVSADLEAASKRVTLKARIAADTTTPEETSTDASQDDEASS